MKNIMEEKNSSSIEDTNEMLSIIFDKYTSSFLTLIIVIIISVISALISIFIAYSGSISDYMYIVKVNVFISLVTFIMSFNALYQLFAISNSAYKNFSNSSNSNINNIEKKVKQKNFIEKIIVNNKPQLHESRKGYTQLSRDILTSQNIIVESTTNLVEKLPDNF